MDTRKSVLIVAEGCLLCTELKSRLAELRDDVGTIVKRQEVLTVE